MTNISKFYNENIKNIDIETEFNNHIQNILNSLNSIDLFIKNFYLFYFDYYLYSIFLYKNELIIQNNINEKFLDLYCNKEFMKFILLNLKNKYIKNIAKIICPYITLHKKINSKIILQYTELIKKNNIIKNSNTFEYIVGLFFYRKMASNPYDCYNDFYINTFFKNENNYDTFLSNLPNAEILLNITSNGTVQDIKKISIIEIIKFIANYLDLNIEIIKEQTKLFIMVNNNKIEITTGNINKIYFNKINMSKINKIMNLQNLESYHTHIVLTLTHTHINNLSILLTYIHLITISLKSINIIPKNIYELENLIEYENYYYDSFVIFFKYIKPQINKNNDYNKFLTELLKYYFLYGYIDYYFYVISDIINLVVENPTKKGNIINDFFKHIRTTFNLPKKLLDYPPFIEGQLNDINNILYYCYDHPNYFKLYDFLNALFFVFNVKHKNMQHFEKLFCNCVNVIVSNPIKLNNKPVINSVDDMCYEFETCTNI